MSTMTQTASVCMEHPPAGCDPELIREARHMLAIHHDTREDRLCQGCLELWARMSWAPCETARWAAQVLTADADALRNPDRRVPTAGLAEAAAR